MVQDEQPTTTIPTAALFGAAEGVIR
jgi:hypothetical protein